MSNASSIAVDWGTSNLRIWVLDHNGDILKELKSDEGMGTLSPDQFEPCLIRHIEPWLGDEVLPVVICGMAGARQGWKEAPYSEAPCAALPSVVDVPTNDKRIKVAIAAGVKQMDPADIMRGEETQIAGFLADHSDFEGVVVLPGTHSKWVEIKSGKITRFQTMMTGESFALYSRQSILRFSMNGWNEADFLANIKKVFAEPERAVSHLFSIRARDILLGDKTGESALSGILIGTELAAIADLWRAQNVAIIGVGSLASAYFQALKSLGADCAQFDGSEMSLKGLKQIMKEIQ